ncbi:hypothetical protein E2C01_063768 [Portunus trituberculatus]|uniref:Uncharacterized protein n=1 Tax=Portunus trituberculatus TaxID=210409 RepID=A0A5B7HBD0_PORTR|nr:hypothetical protein [Portunus trituberculatus]
MNPSVNKTTGGAGAGGSSPHAGGGRSSTDTNMTEGLRYRGKLISLWRRDGEAAGIRNEQRQKKKQEEEEEDKKQERKEEEEERKGKHI